MSNFKVNWILKCQYPFKQLDWLPGNPLNDNKPVYMSFNSQELPYNLGNYLSYLLLKEGLQQPKNPMDVSEDESKNTTKN